jgi:hypothetical protein
VHVDDANILRLKAVVSHVETEALIRVLQIFQDRNINPQRVSAQRVLLRSQSREVLHIDVEFATSDLPMHALRFIAAKIAEMPITLSTVFGQEPDLPAPSATERVGKQPGKFPRPDNG